MKALSKITALLAALILPAALVACGSDLSFDTYLNDGYLMTIENGIALGTPAATLDAKAVYSNLTYTPEMFYGTYRSLDCYAHADFTQFNTAMGLIDYESDYAKQITAMPYSLKAGRFNLNSSKLLKATDCDWMQLVFRSEKDHNVILDCAYEISGKTLVVKPLKDWSYDETADTVTYEFSGTEFRYDFAFEGMKLTLSRDGKSVEYYGGLKYDENEPFVHTSAYVCPDSPKLADIDELSMGCSVNSSYAGSYAHDPEFASHLTTAKLFPDGRVRLTVETDHTTGATASYELVYFYCGSDGIIFTDGSTCYRYLLPYTAYCQSKLSGFLEDEEVVEEMPEEKLETIVEKTENLVQDLAAAFRENGLSVQVDEATGEMAMDAEILFGGDSAVLRDEGKELLDKFIDAYAKVVTNEKYQGFIASTRVEGHTAPVNGDSFEEGMPLSVERAEVVRDYCLSNPAAASLASSMVAVGMSNGTPVIGADGQVDLAASRRVAFRFIINLG